jgi:L-asparaginase
MPALSGEELLAKTPELRQLADLEVEEFSRVASPHLGPGHWVELHRRVENALRREEVTGVVISHGTALMEETAWFLDLTISDQKPVVLVGAQRNASAPDFDGPSNLVDGVRVSISPAARGNGVMVVLNHHINAAREATKTHTFDVETFKSGEWGYLGNVAPEGVVFHRAPRRRQHLPLLTRTLPVVEVVSMYAGATGALVLAASEYAKGIVVQAVGAGHVNQPMFDAITQAIGNGVKVVIATRIPSGGVRSSYGFVGSSARLKQAGAILGSDLSAIKARVLLMLALQTKQSNDEIQALFDA